MPPVRLRGRRPGECRPPGCFFPPADMRSYDHLDRSGSRFDGLSIAVAPRC
jgi:hypothetical protein